MHRKGTSVEVGAIGLRSYSRARLVAVAGGTLRTLLLEAVAAIDWAI